MYSKPTALKTAVVMSHRGFESLSLRQSLFEYEMVSFESFQAVFETIAIAADSRNSVGGFIQSRNVVEGERAASHPVTADVRTEWERLIGDFEASIQASGLALRTVEHYSDVLRRVLLGFCERAGVPPRDLTKRHLERLAAELLQSGRSRQSVKTYLSAANRFLRWCSEEGELVKLRAPQPSVERKVLDVLRREEIRRIEDAADTERDKLIVRVPADTAIRVGELRRLRTTDLVPQGRERYLRVRGKGAKERLVPVTPGLYSRLDRYARRSRPEAGTHPLASPAFSIC